MKEKPLKKRDVEVKPKENEKPVVPEPSKSGDVGQGEGERLARKRVREHPETIRVGD